MPIFFMKQKMTRKKIKRRNTMMHLLEKIIFFFLFAIEVDIDMAAFFSIFFLKHAHEL